MGSPPSQKHRDATAHVDVVFNLQNLTLMGRVGNGVILAQISRIVREHVWNAMAALDLNIVMEPRAIDVGRIREVFPICKEWVQIIWNGKHEWLFHSIPSVV